MQLHRQRNECIAVIVKKRTCSLLVCSFWLLTSVQIQAKLQFKQELLNAHSTDAVYTQMHAPTNYNNQQKNNGITPLQKLYTSMNARNLYTLTNIIICVYAAVQLKKSYDRIYLSSSYRRPLELIMKKLFGNIGKGSLFMIDAALLALECLIYKTVASIALFCWEMVRYTRHFSERNAGHSPCSAFKNLIVLFR